MGSPITAWARSFVRNRATEVMEFDCRIERVERPENYDEDTLVLTPSERTTIYEGKCRVWELAGAAIVAVGETDTYQQATQLSIPWDTSAIVKRYDEVEIITAPVDSQMIGKRFEIQNVAKAGELRATRRFEVTSVMSE
jgi:hypothetical protein